VCGSKSIPKWMLDTVSMLIHAAAVSPAFFDGQSFAEPVQTMTARGMPPATRMFTALIMYHNRTDDNAADLLTMLRTVTTTFEATDPRDKLYAVLNMASREDAMAVMPDYSKSPDCVFTDFIRSLVQRDKSLDCLLFNHMGTNDFGPSWIPDIYGRFEAGEGWVSGENLYQASSDLECDVEFVLNAEHSLLIAKGAKVGVVDVVIGPFASGQSGSIVSGSSGYGSGMLQRIAEFSRTLSGSVEHDRLWRTLIMDMDFSDLDDPITPAPERFRDDYEVTVGLTDMPDNFEPGLPQAVRQVKFYQASDFQANFYETVENRCFFRTDSGEMGSGHITRIQAMWL
jgi:hypothetical protein